MGLGKVYNPTNYERPQYQIEALDSVLRRADPQ